MIDPLTERVISLTAAARLCPKRRGGKKTHVSCLYRWTRRGCRDVVLESIQVGGTRCTSREALARFFSRLTLPPGKALTIRTTANRHRKSSRIDAELDREGF